MTADPPYVNALDRLLHTAETAVTVGLGLANDVITTTADYSVIVADAALLRNRLTALDLAIVGIKREMERQS